MSNDETCPCRWSRLRVAVGPTAAGLIGGSLTGLMAIPCFVPLCRNMAATYDQYPSLPRPWLAADFQVPVVLSLLAVIIGAVGPMATGVVAVWLARTRDAWADLSAGVSAAVAATLSAFAAGIGFPVVLALVVVPSIADLTTLSESKAAEAAAKRYPDLNQVEPAKRGEKLMPKIVADQIAGGANAVWVGLLIAGLTAGSHTLVGAFAAGYLRRRGETVRTGILPYVELTLPPTLTLALVVSTVLTPVWHVIAGENPFAIGWTSLFGLAAGAALIVAAVALRWPGWLRLALGLTWFLVLIESKNPMIPWILPVIGAVLTGVLVIRARVVRLHAHAAA
jgi:hypothetical protein